MEENEYDKALENSDQVDESEVKDSEEGQETEVAEAEVEGKDAKSPSKKPQSREENAEFAKKRREAEKAAKEKAEKENQEKLQRESYDKGFIEGIGGKNPYTDEPIEDEEDLRLYRKMKEIDDRGGDPKMEIFKVLREERTKAKEEEKAKAENAEKVEKDKKERLSKAEANIKALEEAHKECNREWFADQWKNNAEFKKLLVHGITPLEAYEILGMGNGEQQKRSTPSSISTGSSKEKSVKDMSIDEVEKLIKTKHGGF